MPLLILNLLETLLYFCKRKKPNIIEIYQIRRASEEIDDDVTQDG